MEGLLLFAFGISIGILMIPNLIIQKAKAMVEIERMGDLTYSRTWYDERSIRLLQSEHSPTYQVLFFLMPVAMIAIAYGVWMAYQFPHSNWPPYLIALLAIHLSSVLILILLPKWIRKKLS